MNILTFFQIVISILLVGSVILQSRGNQRGGTFGGGFGQTYSSKKGIEKFLFWATIVLAALFASVSILSVLA